MLSVLQNINVCKIPDQNSNIYKDECLYCFDTSDSVHGLYICMRTFIAVCRNHLELFYRKCNNVLFLKVKVEKHFKSGEGDGIEEEVSDYQKLIKKTLLSNNVESMEINGLLLMPTYEELDLPCELPEHVAMSVKQILAADSVAKACDRGIQGDNWDGNYLQESKHAIGLKQLDNGVKVAPNGWKCNYCDLTSNLWMNLTDGTILCGRKFFDGTGGNNHAVEHFQRTQYPLAVKLGTITPTSADVFSYAEDDMVSDPLLSVHLAHFGIDIMKMEKTEKSIEELTMERIKLGREQSVIMDADANQELLKGPGLTGIVNTGNSCYLNSVLQILLSLAPFQALYADPYFNILERQSVVDDVTDFRLQMTKLGHFLRTGDYSHLPLEIIPKEGEVVPVNPKIEPQLLRYIVGKGHPDFSTKQQQDAFEFLIHILNMMKVDIKKFGGEINPLDSVSFNVEDRIFCNTTKTVKYQHRDEFVLSLGIPLDQAVNKVEIKASGNNATGEDTVKPVVNFQSCLDMFTNENVIDDYIVNGQRGLASQSSKLATFPAYLWVHLKRFTVGEDWKPKKLDVEVDMPDTIDLTNLRARGLQSHEVEMRDETVQVAASQPMQVDRSMVAGLVEMGFPETACVKAVHLTGGRSQEEAAEWLMVHIGEEDFDWPMQGLATAAMTTTNLVENAVSMLTEMGFSRQKAERALQETGGNLERAVDWAFSHDDPVSMETNQVEASTNQEGGRYRLVGLVSHMGTNAHVGHYVCHRRRDDGSWVLFNDEAVHRSILPPKRHAYLYLFEREA